MPCMLLFAVLESSLWGAENSHVSSWCLCQVRLVDGICAVGGVRAQPSREDLRLFVENIASLNGTRVAELLRAKMVQPCHLPLYKHHPASVLDDKALRCGTHGDKKQARELNYAGGCILADSASSSFCCGGGGPAGQHRCLWGGCCPLPGEDPATV